MKSFAIHFMRRNVTYSAVFVLAMCVWPAMGQIVSNGDAAHPSSTDKASTPAAAAAATPSEAHSYSIVHLGPGDALEYGSRSCLEVGRLFRRESK